MARVLFVGVCALFLCLGSALAGHGVAQAPPPVQYLQFSEAFSGQLQSGGTAEITIPIDPMQRVLFVVSSPVWEIELTLTDPQGIAIDPSTPGVNYSKTAFPFGTSITYMFDAPTTGFWIAHVHSLSANPITFRLSADLVQAPLSLTVEAAPLAVRANEPVTLRAVVDDGGIPVTGATVRALVLVPEGGLVPATLADDGIGQDTVADDGVYTAVFSATTLSGGYHASVTASGTNAADQPFGRMTSIVFYASAHQAQILDTFSDAAQDLTFNGLFDELVIDVLLRIEADGLYQVTGTLRDALGRELAGYGAAWLTAGDTHIELRFDGSAIGMRGANGPYRLTLVHLDEYVSGQYLTIAESRPRYKTAAYAASDFEGFVPALGRPRLAAHGLSVVNLGEGRYGWNLQVTNVGTGPCRALVLRDIEPFVVVGSRSGAVRLLDPPTPAMIGDLEAGASIVLAEQFAIPRNVWLLWITERLACVDGGGVLRRFAVGDWIVVPHGGRR